MMCNHTRAHAPREFCARLLEPLLAGLPLHMVGTYVCTHMCIQKYMNVRIHPGREIVRTHEKQKWP